MEKFDYKPEMAEMTATRVSNCQQPGSVPGSVAIQSTHLF